MVSRREVVEYDEAVVLRNVTWSDYERIDALRGESACPRLTYVDGQLELVAPTQRHELDKCRLRRLFEAYTDELDVPVEGIGSWTIKNKRKKLGAEADECYVLAPIPLDNTVTCPDLVIEVVYRRSSVDKLAVGNRLGAKEVWFWTLQLALEIYIRRGERLVRSDHSALVPGIDPALLVRCMDAPSQHDALRVLREGLRRRR